MTAVLGKKTYQQVIQEGFEKRTGEPAWLFQIRQSAFDRFKALGFPNRKNEAWKYIYLESLLQGTWNSAADANQLKIISAPSFGPLVNEENRLFFINGVYQGGSSRISKTFQSLLATRLDDKSEWAKDLLASDVSAEQNPFAAINTVQFKDGVFLRIPKNTALDQPLHLFFTSEGDGRVSYPRILVAAEEGSKVNIVLHLRGNSEGRSFMNAAAEFHLAANSKVLCMLHQQETPDAVQFLSVKARLSEGSHFEAVGYSAGGSIIRNEINIDLKGANAFASASGLSVLSGNSQVFQHVTINHQVPHCSSRQLFKNILAGKSLAEFNSMVHVWRDAKQSDSEQMDKNLLLSETARIYSRPQLKIDNDDVRANHGAATGQLEKNELFYLRSRGLDEKQARFILIYGFAKQVLDLMPQTLRIELEKDMEARVRAILSEERSWK